MKEVKCDGCGMRESLDISERNRKIKKVRLATIMDTRDFPDSEERFDADLCPDCRGTLLHTYFSQLAEGTLTVPAFAEPTELERRRA